LFWIGTIPHRGFTPYPVPGAKWFKGQLEVGEGGYLHWQLFICFSQKKSLSGLQELFGREGHWELSRSSAASEYVWKEDTRVTGTQFQLLVLN